MKRQTNLYIIVIGIFMLLISGSFLSEGLSRVGMDNAVVSQRMSEGFEDFWLPSLSAPGNPDRMNYMPLGYWIESLWYRLFGTNTFMAEKIYSVLTYFILGALIIWIWTLSGQSRRSGWLPLLCWITIPIVTWSATNNLLESTMTIFVLLSVAFLLKAGKASFIASSRLALGKPSGPYKLSRTSWIVLAALMMELAFMVKGFAGLFPIFFPFLYWLIVRRERILFPIFSTGVILVVWMATAFVAIFVWPETYTHLYNYLHHQLIGGVLHVRTVASRFYIFYALIIQAAIPICLALAIALIRIKKRPVLRFVFFWRNQNKITAQQASTSRMGWFFFALGLSGVIPVMLGYKQQDFYMVPTLPFFAISLGCLLYNMIDDWLENMNLLAQRVLWGLAILLFVSGLLLNFNSIHRVNSNSALLGDMRLILPYLEDGETLSVSPEIISSPEAEEYFYRYKNIVFDTSAFHKHLLTMYSSANVVPDSLELKNLNIPTQLYKLYELVPKPVDDFFDFDTSFMWDIDSSTTSDYDEYEDYNDYEDHDDYEDYELKVMLGH